VSDVIAAHTNIAGLTLSEFKDAVQDRITELHRGYRKSGQPQTLRVVTDIPSDGFFFLPSPRTWSPHTPQPPAAGADATTATVESAAMHVEVSTPKLTRPARSIRPGRRALPVLALLGLLAITAWAVLTYNGNGNGNDNGGKSDKAGSETPPTPSPSSTRPSSENSETSTSSPGSGQDTLPAGSVLPVCAPSAVKLTLRSLHNTYAPGAYPTFALTAINSSGSDCKMDFGPERTVLTITKADSDDPYWSSADCPTDPGSLVFRVPAGDSITYTVQWDRWQGTPECSTPPTDSAGAGAYLVEAKAPGFAKTQASFVLNSD
ncbi:hypothetical protein, partial [Streptomyces sp. NPDC054837]